MDRLDELATFVAIIEEGSLAAAGRKLRRSPPAVTHALAVLEDRVGARLVERTTRRCQPTEAGRRFADHARQVLTGYRDAVGEVATGAIRGNLRLTAPLVFGRRHITPIVTSFLDAHPGVRIELVLGDRNLNMVDEALDVALRIGPLTDASLVVRKVGEVRRVVVASPSYLAGRPPVQSPRDLAGHEIIFTATRPGPLEWRFTGSGRAQVVRLVPRLIVNEVDATLAAARAGRGIARALSYQVADDLASRALVRLLVEHEPRLAVQLVVPSARHTPPVVRAFIDHAVRALTSLAVIHPVQ